MRNRYSSYLLSLFLIVSVSSLNSSGDSGDRETLNKQQLDQLKQDIERQESYQCEGTAGYPACKTKLENLKAQYAKAVAARGDSPLQVLIEQAKDLEAKTTCDSRSQMCDSAAISAAKTQYAQAVAAIDAMTEACANNNYKNCYMGVPWGTLINENQQIPKCPDLPNLGAFSNVYSHNCDPLIKELEDQNLSAIQPGQCDAIIANGKLVGFYKQFIVKKDDALFLTAKLKKKYGPKPLKSSCKNDPADVDAIPVNTWEDANGINIQTQETSFGSDRKIFVRYLNNDVLKKIAVEIKAAASKQKSDAEAERIKKLGNGL